MLRRKGKRLTNSINNSELSNILGLLGDSDTLTNINNWVKAIKNRKKVLICMNSLGCQKHHINLINLIRTMYQTPSFS